MKRELIALLLLLLLPLVAIQAIPARPDTRRILTLHDNTAIEVTLQGDEHLHYWQAADGRTFDDDGMLISAFDMQLRRQQALQRRRVDTRRRAVRRAPGNIPIHHYTDAKRGLIILVEFADKQFLEGHDQPLYNRIANEEGFSDEGFNGSVHDYFLDQSRGLFDLTFDVVGPVPMPEGYAYYGTNDKDGYDMHPDEMVIEACNAVKNIVDFADYDWDGNGEVDQVMIIYAGRGEASGGGAKTIWPHEWNLTEAQGKPLVLNDITIDTYACSCELQSATKIDGIGSTCHEYSHCLGLPDMYDISYSGNYGMRTWSLMDRGSYNGDSFTPAGFTSFERMCCGWLTPIELTTDTEITAMKALTDGGDAYILYNDAWADEFYLIENRQLTGWDACLDDAGMLILHVDYDEIVWYWNMVNTTADYTEEKWYGPGAVNDHQRCTIFRANNLHAPYPYKDKNSLTPTSSPAATLYHENSEGTLLMNANITDITQNDDGTMSFAFKRETTAISPVISATQAAGSRIYSLDGHDMGTDFGSLTHGVYIYNGKKVRK